MHKIKISFSILLRFTSHDNQPSNPKIIHTHHKNYLTHFITNNNKPKLHKLIEFFNESSCSATVIVHWIPLIPFDALTRRLISLSVLICHIRTIQLALEVFCVPGDGISVDATHTITRELILHLKRRQHPPTAIGITVHRLRIPKIVLRTFTRRITRCAHRVVYRRTVDFTRQCLGVPFAVDADAALWRTGDDDVVCVWDLAAVEFAGEVVLVPEVFWGVGAGAGDVVGGVLAVGGVDGAAVQDAFEVLGVPDQPSPAFASR